MARQVFAAAEPIEFSPFETTTFGARPGSASRHARHCARFAARTDDKCWPTRSAALRVHTGAAVFCAAPSITEPLVAIELAFARSANTSVRLVVSPVLVRVYKATKVDPSPVSPW